MTVPSATDIPGGPGAGRAGLVRRSVLVLVAGLTAALLAGCGASDGERDAAQAFLAAWARGDVSAAAAATDDPAAATEALQQVDRELGLGAGTLAVGDVAGDGTVAYTASWVLDGVVDPWRYDGRVATVEAPDGTWRVHWEPQDLHPRLGPGRSLAFTRELPPRAAITAADGTPLVGPTPTVTVGIVPARTPDVPGVAAQLAAALQIDAADIVADAARARPGDFVTVTTLRRPDYDAVRARIRDLPGTAFREGVAQLGPTPHYGQPLLGQVDQPSAEDLRAAGPGFTATDEIGTGGLQQVFNDQLAGRATATIDLADTAGRPVERLATFPGRPGVPVRTTLDARVQQAAETALTGVAPTAAIVAVRPSTGAVLAVANSTAAPFDVALAGRYPPGSTFKMVTAAAALQAGLVRADTPVACPGTTTIDGRVIPNEDGFDLGTVPFTDAFARSCNTTMAQLSQRLAPDALGTAAGWFGIGSGWRLPVDSFDGAYTPGSDPAAVAADSFGQGTDLVSPLAEALMAATVVRGSTPPPTLVPDRPTAVARPPTAPPPGVVAALAPMMRDVVTRGTAPELAAVPGGPVSGKTGTAEHDTPPRAHSWFTGYQGDLAFSVFVEDGQTGGVPANPVAARFLAALSG
jgi:cell division protein FtsI/penicillin-binding protein 2